jgi:hypothetical protein
MREALTSPRSNWLLLALGCGILAVAVAEMGLVHAVAEDGAAPWEWLLDA